MIDNDKTVCIFYLAGSNDDARLGVAVLPIVPNIGHKVHAMENAAKWTAVYNKNVKPILLWKVIDVVWYLGANVSIEVIPICDDKETKPNV